MDDDRARQLGAALAEAGLRRRPVAVLDLDAVDANLADLRRRAGGKPVRLASKSLRCRRLIEHGLAADGVAGVMAFTLPEALRLARSGVADVLLAYPTVDADALAELAADDELRRRVTLMVDCREHLDLAEAVADRPGAPAIRVCLELDAAWSPVRRVRFGALRSPLRTPADLVALACDAAGRAGVRVVGLMAYEGQIAGVPDLVGGRAYRQAVAQMKRRSGRELARRRAAAVAALREVAPLEFVNGGGTGSLEQTAAEPAVTELAAGSGVVGPALFDGYRGFRPQPALHFGLDVVRRPGAGVATVAGGGWLASGPGASDRLPSIAWPQGLRYAPQEGAGEVQTPLVGAAADDLRVGDTVWLRHAKAGELAERVAEYVVVRGLGQDCRVVDTWPTYRGEGLVSP